MSDCDGCVAGMPITLKDGIHRLSDGSPFQVCDSESYPWLEVPNERRHRTSHTKQRVGAMTERT